MDTPASATISTGVRAFKIGVLAPLSKPGWTSAGRHLLAGLELAAGHANEEEGVYGRSVELVVRDSAADPRIATAAVDELAKLGVDALAGEYHSVVARAVAARADAVGLPFLCSSAVLDELTETPTERVARLAPAQSHGWGIFADFLLDEGHRRIALATQPSVYWAAGARILRDVLEPKGCDLIELDMGRHAPESIADALAGNAATALLLLVGHPEPAVAIVRSVRQDPRLEKLLIAAPAGQPEFPEWEHLLGKDGAAIAFLRYLPERFGPLGMRVGNEIRAQLGEAPSFVAYEGYDTVTVLVHAFRSRHAAPPDIADLWGNIAVEGSRGTIRFSRVSGINVWQWAWAPVQVADRDPASPDRFRVLRSA